MGNVESISSVVSNHPVAVSGALSLCIIGLLIAVLIITLNHSNENGNCTDEGNIQTGAGNSGLLSVLGEYNSLKYKETSKELLWRELIRRDQAIEAYLTGYTNQMIENIKEMNEVIYNNRVLLKPLHLIIPPGVIIITDKTSILKEHETAIKTAFSLFQSLEPIDKLEALGRYSKYLVYELDDETVIINNPHPSETPLANYGP